MSDSVDQPSPPFTEATRARMVLAAEAAELADFARGFVPIGEHDLQSDGKAQSHGQWAEEAARLASMAQRVLRAAVVFERLGGATWPEIGNALDVTKQTAQERFDPAVSQFRDELYSPENPGYTGEFGQLRWRLHHAALDPEETAARLDEWVGQHADPTDDPGPAPVSGGLARMDPHAELRWIADLSHQLWRDFEAGAEAGADGRTRGVPPLAARLALAEREVEVYEQIAANQKPSGAVQAGRDHARRTLAQLRSEHAATAAGTTQTKPLQSKETRP